MTATRRKLELVPEPGVPAEIGHFLTALHDTRQRMREVLAGLPADAIDKQPPDGGSSVGTLLYHIALIEADWLFYDILNTQETAWPKELFPAPDREADHTLSPLTGETLEQHLTRLNDVRTMLVETISTMTLDELHELRERRDYDVSAAWVLHHLMQHEAEHRSQIGRVREAIGAPPPSW